MKLIPKKRKEKGKFGTKAPPRSWNFQTPPPNSPQMIRGQKAVYQKTQRGGVGSSGKETSLLSLMRVVVKNRARPWTYQRGSKTRRAPGHFYGQRKNVLNTKFRSAGPGTFRETNSHGYSLLLVAAAILRRSFPILQSTGLALEPRLGNDRLAGVEGGGGW